ncbi:hypothetical protein C0989_000467 [Termitomyces sp. Mn162]|nr:hypothetical protein C0989_000467 [Termitomyces sp. Mn162]
MLAHKPKTLMQYINMLLLTLTKPQPKNVKVLSVTADHKLSSKAMLTLLFQVNAVLNTKNGSVLHANLQKCHDAIDLTAQQQLYALDTSPQTFKLIAVHFDHLDQTVSYPEVNQTGDPSMGPHVLPKVHLFYFFFH